MDKSLHELITELCEKHIDQRKYFNEGISVQPILKKLRSKVFDLLLNKRCGEDSYNELEGNTDPICHLLAWQYTLKNEFNQPEKAEELRMFTDRLKDSEMLKDSVVQNIILFLLYLRNSEPDEKRSLLNSDIFDKVTLKHKTSNDSLALPYDIYTEDCFKLSKPLKSDDKGLTTFSVRSFSSQPSLTMRVSKSVKSVKSNDRALTYSTNFDFQPLLQCRPSRSYPTANISESENIILDEGYYSPIPKITFPSDIWETASKLPINEYKNWECLETIEPNKELPFACESSPQTLHCFRKIMSSLEYTYVENENNIVPTDIITTAEFVKNVKFMLVGMASDVFIIDDNDMLCLRKGVCIEGLSHESLESYCTELLCCGSCYRALNQLCYSVSTVSNSESYGYIFKELCESVKRYLAFYRVAALSVSETASLLTLHKHMHRLKDQISALARMCRVGIYAHDASDTPLGVELLNYMYQEITKITCRDVALVLYSAFYPCCQVYFSHFLQRWLFQGILIDPYEEFLVKPDDHYINSRSRTYWTRSFSLRPDAIPDFLLDLKKDILQCGKTMNLLKLCKPDAHFYSYLEGRSLPLISCCLTSEQISRSKQEIDCYFIEVATLCGPRISLYHKLRERYEENLVFLSWVEKKRALTIKKIELKRQHEAEEKAKKKKEILKELREQMRLASEHKKKEKEEELKRELVRAEQNAQIEELRSKLVKEEAKKLIKYYSNLIEAVDQRRSSIAKRKKQIEEETHLNTKIKQKALDSTSPKANKKEQITSESENKDIGETNFKTEAVESSSTIDTDITDEFFDCDTKPSSTASLDEANANVDEPVPLSREVKMNNQLNENFLAARRNRAKVLNLEFGVKVSDTKMETITSAKDISNLTDAQKNKLRVLNSEFGIFSTDEIKTNKPIIENENNGNSLTENILPNNKPITEQITETSVANANTKDIAAGDKFANIRDNLASPGHEDVMNVMHRKRINELPTLFENDKMLAVSNTLEQFNLGELQPSEVTPMSIDSTPNTECPPTELPTPSSAKLSLCTDIVLDSAGIMDSGLLTTNSNITDDGFKFPYTEPKKFIYENCTRLIFADKKRLCITENIPQTARPMRLSKEDVKEITNNNLKLLLYESVHVPLDAQMRLVNSEILKYFINDQKFFSHLHSLRCYYFLLDGEFGRHITEGLFNKLYEARNPSDLLNCQTLQLIVNKALYASSKVQENAERLSFIVQNVPQRFDLSSADVLECLSLSYKISWPLNILLPCDAIERYDLVFKYLLKLHHVSWILQKMFQELKLCQVENGVDESVFMRSPQYHKLQLFRHIMTHFIQTLQNYTVSEVLQTSWEELENNMKEVNTLDQLYSVHVVYIKTIMFRCLLNKNCFPIMKVIREIFVVILKFYNYLRSRQWIQKETENYLTHPNFKKLESIFQKFEEFTNFVFRLGNKIARVGYQPHLVQMLDMLNMNAYYTNKQNM